jgi:hypothetical protein
MTLRLYVLGGCLGSLLLVPAVARAADLPGTRDAALCVPPIVTITQLLTITDWCDPGDRNLLQRDVYGKQSNGSKGAWKSTTTGILCSNTSVPSTVRQTLCP